MGYISALTHASVLIRSKNVHLLFKVTAKDTNNISYTVRYGLGGKAQLVRNLQSGFLAADYMRFLQS